MNSFNRLHKNIQHVLYDMKWEKLHTFQADTINAWFDSSDNIMVMASTAAGKTEAAFLPILSSIAEDKGAGSVRVLLVSPLKALINDQFRRIDELCERADIPVHRWHGDVSRTHKQRLINNPSGILLITPESLESLLINHSRHLQRIFSTLEVCVIDEMHVFIDSERGKQLQCQLSRIDDLLGNNIKFRRIGLSATIGDIELAGNWLSNSEPLITIQSDIANDVVLTLKTFIDNPDKKDFTEYTLSNELVRNFSHNTNLIFCNSKIQIEQIADEVASISKERNLPNRFLVHHGAISKMYREDVEQKLKSSHTCSAICSSTLELGIDIGNVDAVVQIGPAHSISSLKQRLGRSGRKEGKASILHNYIPVISLGKNASIIDRLYPDLIQAIAMVEILAHSKGWVEPPKTNVIDYSTLIQQVLSLIKQSGAISASSIYNICCRVYPYKSITQDRFIEFLKDLGNADLIEQIEDSKLILGIEGEKIANYYDFYVAFETKIEYSVISQKGQVGSIEGITGTYLPGDYIILAGKRWKIIQVDEDSLRIDVIPAKEKKMVKWSGEPGTIHKNIREKMFHVLSSPKNPQWLDKNTSAILNEAKSVFSLSLLNQNMIIEQYNKVYLFTWTSTEGNYTLKLLLAYSGIPIDNISDEGIGLIISNITIEEVNTILKQLSYHMPTCEDLLYNVFKGDIPGSGKYGFYLSNSFRCESFISNHINIEHAKQYIDTIK